MPSHYIYFSIHAYESTCVHEQWACTLNSMFPKSLQWGIKGVAKAAVRKYCLRINSPHSITTTFENTVVFGVLPKNIASLPSV